MAVTSAVLPRLGNSQPIPLGDVPVVDFDEFRELLVGETAEGGRLSALFAKPALASDKFSLFAVVNDPHAGTLTVFQTTVGDSYPSLTPLVPAAQGFEREIAENWAVVPEGHPWFRPVRYVRSRREGKDAWNRPAGEEILPCVGDFFRIEGREIHEVAVGPIHAGVIEPGHFRFSCYGEIVHHLEIALGYQHRGVEPALRGGPNKRTIHYMETLSGDSSIGHATAYCQAMEALAGVEAPIQAQAIRGVAAELERMANHVGDLGALALDVAYLPTSSYCGRLRGDYLNATAAICGSRFGRGLVRPGGTVFDVEPKLAETLVERLAQPLVDTKGALDLMWSSTSTVARFEDCCPVKQADAIALGLVGMAARSCGIDVDVRRDFPTGIYRFAQVPVSTVKSGDIYARGFLRSLEVERSGKFIVEQLKSLPGGRTRTKLESLQPDALVVSLFEGWRGEICHVAITDSDGKFDHYKVVDPSFHNWFGLAMSLRDQAISDFPVSNKSFNLSYCGHDL